jgi:hypothetical protein
LLAFQSVLLVKKKETVMAIIRIQLEDEHGGKIEEVEGNTHMLNRILPLLNENSFQCLRFIDPYGDTVFNRMQMDQFLFEWDQVSRRATTAEEKELLERVKRLAEKCQSKPHLYLKFYGD